jgi:hypothetical protein
MQTYLNWRLMATIDLTCTDVFRKDPALVLLGVPDEQPARVHAELPPAPPAEPHHPRARARPWTEAEILAQIRRLRADLEPFVAEAERLQRALDALAKV